MGPKLRSQADDDEVITTQLKLLENIQNQMMQAKEHGYRRKTIRYKVNLEKKIEQVSQLITNLSDEKINEGTNVDDVLLWTNSQESKLDQFESQLEEIEEWLDLPTETTSNNDREKRKTDAQQQREQHEWMLQQQITVQQQMEEMFKRNQEREEEWHQRKLEMEETMMLKKINKEEKMQQQKAKLQKYTITKFNGDYKDWLRFWNQFIVEVDGSNLAEITKFNYLLELVEGRPKEDILGLPHSDKGYEEAKEILQKTYGKDIKVHKALIQELEGLPAITSIHKMYEIHEFYSKLSRTVRTLATMKKLDTAQA